MKYDKSAIMKRAWEINRDEEIAIWTAMKVAWAEVKHPGSRETVTVRRIQELEWEFSKGGKRCTEYCGLAEVWYFVHQQFPGHAVVIERAADLDAAIDLKPTKRPLWKRAFEAFRRTAETLAALL